MKKTSRILTLSALIFCCITLNAQTQSQPDCSVPFASYADSTLELDIYLPQNLESAEPHYCVIYTYGGGFITDNQKSGLSRTFCRRLADNGYVVVASNYRLGMKGVKMKSRLGMVKPLHNAIEMATEDIFKATVYVLDNAGELNVRPDGIILCGSSAGAITSLQCDYELCNRTGSATILPEDFRYAGVISFAGAVLSSEGKCDYRNHAPAPTMLLHGTSDALVTYNKIAFFNKRFSGSNDLVKRFARNGWSYEIIRFEGEGHSVSTRMLDNFDDVMWFIDNMVIRGRHFTIDKSVNDRDRIRPSWDNMSPDAMY